MVKEQMFPVKKLVMLTAKMAEAIQTFRHANKISSENEAYRQLLATGLEKSEKIPKD